MRLKAFSFRNINWLFRLCIFSLLHCLVLCPWHCAYLLTYLTSSPLHQRALADNLSALPPEVILWCLVLAQPLHSIGPSRLWAPLLVTVSHMKFALFHGICPARFTSSLKLLFSPGPGLGASLSSYLEVTLYKFHR